MSRKRKMPAVPSMVPRKYHHEIKCVFQQFQCDILSDILKQADLDDKSFVKVCKFSDFVDTPTGILALIKDIKGNEISKRLYGIRKAEENNQ